MKIELKNIKYMASMSEETACFQASVYVDGKKEGDVSNRGTGGADDIYPRALEDQLDAYAATLPHEDISDFYHDGQTHTSPRTAESVIGQLLDDYLTAKENKRLCKNKTVYRLPSHTYKKGEYHVSNSPFTPKAREMLDKKYGPGVFILNESLTA